MHDCREELPVASEQQRSILVVEDEAVVAEDLQHRLAALRYQVAGWASTGEDAVRLAHELRPDLVMMDIRIRGEMDGIDAARAIRDRADVPVVFVTALADGETLARAKAVEPLGYIVKPFSDRDLETTVELALYKHEIDSRLRQSNAELADERGFLDAMFEAVPSSVLVLDGASRIRRANRSFKYLHGISDADDGGVELGSSLSCPQALENPGGCGLMEQCLTCQIHRPYRNALQGEVTVRERCTFESMADGQPRRLTLLVTAAPLVYKGDEMALVILEDVTELSSLRELLRADKSFAGLVGASPKMLEVFGTIREIVDVDVPVLILGESGTGKELVARALHNESRRARGPFVPVNCSALPDGLLESELFGHVKGAFTGAIRDRKGRFELADGGTIFLDEIGDLSPTMQVKLLRVLQEMSFERVGAEKTVTVNVRVVCATNRDLSAEVEAGRFRDDLFYRLCVVPITMPPLRERADDIPLLAEHILGREAASSGGRRVSLTPDAVSALVAYDWPGNVRELQNALQYAFIKCKTDAIERDHLPPAVREAAGSARPAPATGSGLSTEAIEDALRKTGGNRTKAAKLLGVSRATFYRHLDACK
jgi:DNA-binding NtrC family response regulator